MNPTENPTGNPAGAQAHRTAGPRVSLVTDVLGLLVSVAAVVHFASTGSEIAALLFVGLGVWIPVRRIVEHARFRAVQDS